MAKEDLYNKDQSPNTESGKKGLVHWKVVAFFLMLYDIIAIHVAYFLALWMRFDFVYSAIPRRFKLAYVKFVTVYAVFCVIVFWIIRIYRSVWRYAGEKELFRVGAASIGLSVAHAFAITLIFRRMPMSYYFAGLMLQAVFLVGIRFSYRVILYLRSGRSGLKKTASRVMLIGAGSAGQMILKDIERAPEKTNRVVCIIDDNPNKWNRYMDGVPIVGGRDEIMAAAEKYRVDKIYLAIPSATAAEKRDILNICSETGCELKQLPGMYQFVLGQVSISAMRDVSVDDLLGREPIKSDLSEVFSFINGKTVLVTGGGGSIGSELCRQIAAHEPGRLIILDIYENNAYDIQLELREKYPRLDLVTLIASVRDSRRMFGIFEAYRPDIVYHAAAHKHVPLMEDSPCEAIKNNAIGTYKTAYAAAVFGCSRFVLISTDKAVHPTNIMGASKRLCEMIIQSFDAKIKAQQAHELPQLFTHGDAKAAPSGKNSVELKKAATEYVAVRFGNVLGSNGSVVPIFKKQIEKGGPVTVTHPDIIRYFMTIPEAVSLVLQAGTYAHGGEIFVLDMGSPVKIDTLARNLIKLSGYRPDEDIKIEYTGLRPGEKLYEEKLMAEEGLKKTENERIHIGNPIPFDTDGFLQKLDGLMRAAYANSPEIRSMVEDVVDTYRPAEEVNKNAAATIEFEQAQAGGSVV